MTNGVNESPFNYFYFWNLLRSRWYISTRPTHDVFSFLTASVSNYIYRGDFNTFRVVSSVGTVSYNLPRDQTHLFTEYRSHFIIWRDPVSNKIWRKDKKFTGSYPLNIKQELYVDRVVNTITWIFDGRWN